MTTSAINAAAATPVATSTAGSSGASPQPLGQDAFLKLLMAQLRNQDPLNPADSTQFVTQLSQFSLVEQSVQQSSQLTSIASRLQAMDNSNAALLVGQQVTVGGNTLAYDGSFAASASVGLTAPAQTVTAIVSDANGNAVRTMSLGPQAAGPLRITWDGHSDSGQPEPAGTYSVAVTAKDASGQPIAVSQDVSGVVASVSFVHGTPTLTLSNGTVAPVSNLLSVGVPTSQ